MKSQSFSFTKGGLNYRGALVQALGQSSFFRLVCAAKNQYQIQLVSGDGFVLGSFPVPRRCKAAEIAAMSALINPTKTFSRYAAEIRPEGR